MDEETLRWYIHLSNYKLVTILVVSMLKGNESEKKCILSLGDSELYLKSESGNIVSTMPLSNSEYIVLNIIIKHGKSTAPISARDIDRKYTEATSKVMPENGLKNIIASLRKKFRLIYSRVDFASESPFIKNRNRVGYYIDLDVFTDNCSEKQEPRLSSCNIDRKQLILEFLRFVKLEVSITVLVILLMLAVICVVSLYQVQGYSLLKKIDGFKELPLISDNGNRVINQSKICRNRGNEGRSNDINLSSEDFDSLYHKCAIQVIKKHLFNQIYHPFVSDIDIIGSISKGNSKIPALFYDKIDIYGKNVLEQVLVVFILLITLKYWEYIFGFYMLLKSSYGSKIEFQPVLNVITNEVAYFRIVGIEDQIIKRSAIINIIYLSVILNKTKSLNTSSKYSIDILKFNLLGGDSSKKLLELVDFDHVFFECKCDGIEPVKNICQSFNDNRAVYIRINMKDFCAKKFNEELKEMVSALVKLYERDNMRLVFDGIDSIRNCVRLKEYGAVFQHGSFLD